MSFRDRPVTCPRCKVPLAQSKTGERWRCKSCRGAAITTSDLLTELHAIIPDLAPSKTPAPAPVVTEEKPRPVTPLECPVCGTAMVCVAIGPVVLDDCPADETLWFDDWEHVTVLAAARDPDQRSWLEQMLRSIIPPPEPESAAIPTAIPTTAETQPTDGAPAPPSEPEKS